MPHTVLEFDHVRGEKVTTLNRMVANRFSIGLIQAEIQKCEVRCSNCHRRKTARTVWPKLREKYAPKEEPLALFEEK